VECYDLGRIAYTSGDYYHTLMWMQEALDHLDTEVNNTSLSKIDILDHLAFATSQVKRVFEKEVLIWFVLARKY
jgi:hypothetical protein